MLSKYTTLSQIYNGASIKLDGQDFFINKRKFNINNLSLIKLRYDIYAVNKKNELLIFIFSKKRTENYLSVYLQYFLQRLIARKY
jgi:hypothetical protein